MPDNTNKNSKLKPTLEATRVSIESEVASAKILISEGLLDEAKKLLYQVLLVNPQHPKAKPLLAQILSKEEKLLFQNPGLGKKLPPPEDPRGILEKLNQDLHLGFDLTEVDPEKENWISSGDLSARERYDLGVAFSEMGCYLDAIRELKIAERKIRLEQSFLGELGVSVVTLYSECLLNAKRAFEAKTYLEPILSEPDLKHEEKIGLFYVMGLVEEQLGDIGASRGWLKLVVDSDVHFRDAQFRLKQRG